MTRPTVRKLSFSLVELVIVIVIIGIIAAIAVPRASRAAGAAAETSIRADLQLVRKAIELYAAEHGGVYPAAKTSGSKAAGSMGAFKRQLIQYTDAEGLKSNTLDRANFPYGPYLVRLPAAPLGPAQGDRRAAVKSAGTPLSGKANPGKAWRYDCITGQFIFGYNGVSSDGVTTYDEW